MESRKRGVDATVECKMTASPILQQVSCGDLDNA